MTSLEYSPGGDAELSDHWQAVYLSMRDASGQIPINFVTNPGVHVTQACFSNGVYDDIPTQTCISDLFASQFRRLIIDLYWDNINQQFNLCPVELPPLAGNSTAGYSVDSSALFSITASNTDPSSTPVPISTSASNTTTSLPATIDKRQAVSTSGNSSTFVGDPTTTPIPSPTSTSDVSIPTSTGVSGGTLLQLGPYMCSLDLNVGSIISLYNSYFDQTSDTISVRLQFLDINIHAAAPFTDPSAPAHTPMPARLPDGDDLIGAQFRQELGDDLFTPHDLQTDRNDLNKSWYRDNYRIVTDLAYFHTEETGSDGAVTTSDGWPGESWLLLTDSRRLLVSWGEIDPQMSEYDFLTDSHDIFNASDVFSRTTVEWNGDGDVTSGCFYHENATVVSATNASWAMALIDNTNPDALPNLAQTMTACGISPVLNMSLGGRSTQNNLAPFQEFVQSSVFGWGSGQPSNASSSKDDRELRCAVIDSTSGYNGHWRVDSCQKSRRAACRIAHEPYAWRLSTFKVPFGSAPDACPESTRFDLPRTGLENTYLHRQILHDLSGDCDDDCEGIMEGVWINFNSLDQADCWVIDGPNATCPYSDFQEEQQQREVLIPTIAAIIILILSVLTIIVKCNQNRRNGRTRRRGDNGWDYEGVPS